MGRVASQITSLTIVYTTVYSDADQSKHQSSASLAFVWGIHRDRWIPRTKGQLRGKCFHLMTSSCASGRCDTNYKSILFKFIIQTSTLDIHCEVASGEHRYHRSSLIWSWHWFKKWFGVVRQQAEVSLMKLPSNECHWTLHMIGQHWF